MSDSITLGPIHHIALRVSDLQRSIRFYGHLFGFQQIVTLAGLTLLSNGTLILGLIDHVLTHDDCVVEPMIGLDHLSFSVNSRTDLELALVQLDRYAVPHGPIEDRGRDLRMYVLALHDPDNIRLELIASYT